MPLFIKKRTVYLDKYLESEEITDIIEEGKYKYPVHALCEDHRFVDAVKLIRKGYKILHNKCFEKEFVEILHNIEIGSLIITAGQNSWSAKDELKEFLNEELKEFHDGEEEIIAMEFCKRLYDNTGYYSKQIPCIRKDFPTLYKEILKCDRLKEHFIPVLLLCNDVTFVRDFVEFVNNEGHLEQFDDAIRNFEKYYNCSFDEVKDSSVYVCKARTDVFGIFKEADDNVWLALNTIMRYCPKLLPRNLYGKLAALIVVRMVRREFDETEAFFADTDKWDDGMMIELCPKAVNYIDELEYGLERYMPIEYKDGKEQMLSSDYFKQIISVLIDVCGYNNKRYKESYQFMFDEWEKPHESDFVVMKRMFSIYEKRFTLSDLDEAYDGIINCAEDWRKWYSLMDPEHSAPNSDDFYSGIYEMFLEYGKIIQKV